MTKYFLCLKKNLISPAVLLTCSLLMLITILAFGCDLAKEEWGCAIYAEKSVGETKKIVSYLLEHNFVLCNSKEELYEFVQTGKVSCGMLLSSDMEERIHEGKLEQSIQLVTSPRSDRVEIYSLIASIAVFRVYAPYITTETANRFGFETLPEQIMEYMERYETAYHKIGFEITSVQGYLLEDTKNYDFQTGILAISNFVAVIFLALAKIHKIKKSFAKQYRKQTLLFDFILPEVITLVVCLYLASAIGCVAAGAIYKGDMRLFMLPLAIYEGLLVIFILILSMLRMEASVYHTMTILMATLSFVICPVYLDIVLHLPAIRGLRYLFPTYYLYLAQGDTKRWLFIVLFMMFLLFWVGVWRQKKTEKCNQILIEQ